MSPRLVADVGNTRIKWGVCAADRLSAAVAVPPDDPAAWADQLARWGLADPQTWAVAGVHPARRDRLVAWLRERGAAAGSAGSGGGSALSCSTTARTRSASPAPVTAEIANTGRPSASSRRRRTSPLPVSSDLLRATTSGFAARSGPCSSSSRRMTR